MKKKLDKKNEDKKFPSVLINWYPGHMVKAENEIKSILKLIDIVVEVLDARIPLSSKNPHIDKFCNSKARIIVLNKSDLADKNKVLKWVDYYKSIDIPAILMNTSNSKNISELLNMIKNVGKNLYEQKYKDKKININPIYKVLIAGIPNVGKSTIINKIAGKNSANVGNKPGVTKQKQWIKVSENIQVLDTPGLLWPKLDNETVGINLSLTGNIKQEILDTEEIALEGIKILNGNDEYKNFMYEKYNFNKEDIILNDDKPLEYVILKLIGKKRGCLISGGEVDTLKTSKIFLDDFKNGKIGKISLE